MTRYAVFGLCLESELDFPELPLAVGAPDVTLIRASLGEPSSAPRGAISADEFFVSNPEVGTFHVRGGREIRIDPAEGMAEGWLRSLLLGSMFAMLLLQRGLMVLHAASLGFAGRAVLVMAESGVGKSTTALALRARGHELRSDDVTPLELDGDRTRARPGFPSVRLHEGTARRFGAPWEELPLIHPEHDKRVWNLAEPALMAPLDVACAVVLARGDVGGLRPLTKIEAFAAAMTHTFRLGLVQEAIGQAAHTEQCAALARGVPFVELRVRQGFEHLDETTDLVESFVAGLS